MPKISVVVPVYKCEEYLRECADSILTQSGPELELILVDDGSPDGCPDICDGYAASDSRVRVIHKQNGGLSDARNAGTAVCTGDYVFYLDSDDTVDAGILGSLAEAVIRCGAEIAVAGIRYVYPDGGTLELGYGAEEYLNGDAALAALIGGEKIRNFAWGKLIRRELLDGVEFPVGRYYEDAFWAHRVFARTSGVVLVPGVFVGYRQRSGSISGSFSRKNLDLLEGMKQRREFLKENRPSLLSLHDAHTCAIMEDYCIAALMLGDEGLFGGLRDRCRIYLAETPANCCPAARRVNAIIRNGYTAARAGLLWFRIKRKFGNG